jgi:phage shock protein PspC (stress-responsive transcriptional regulator)
MAATRPCPYCAEEILEEAVLCRYCRSRVTGSDPRGWYRDHPTRKVAGVASGVARALAVPLPLVRAAFVLALLFHLSGLFVYLALWLLMPLPAEGVPPYRRALGWVARQLLRLFGGNGKGAAAGSGNGSAGPRSSSEARPASLDVFP